MDAKTLPHAAEDLVETGKDALTMLTDDLNHAASTVEDAATRTAARGAKALRRQAKRVRGAAMEAGGQAAGLVRHHPYLSAATLVGSLVALTGIALLATRSPSR